MRSPFESSLPTENSKLDDESLSVHGTRRYDINVEDLSRRIWVFTTASLPWMTGTSVNPLLRAAYLTRGRDPGKVTLGVPWLEKDEQHHVFPDDKRYDTQAEQEEYVKDWLMKAGLAEEANKLNILFYPARYHASYGSIFAMGDPSDLVPDEEADVCVLEEPEHLNFFRSDGVPWRKKFEYVVGVIHTNYMFYARGDKGGVVKTPIVRAACAFTVRAHCHRVIKLSDALQGYAKEKELVENVHGVRSRFLQIGEECAGNPCFTADAYFIGKILWSKGIEILLALMKSAKLDGRSTFPIDMYGRGADLDEVKQKAREMGLQVSFHDAIDHAELVRYKVFVNPSQSEVLCTTIAEALAMGKWVVCARHPSNVFFFENFESCLAFSDEDEFHDCMQKALTEDPPKLDPETRYKLTWAAATERFLAAASRPELPGTPNKSIRGLERLDSLLARLHQKAMKGRRGDIIRTALGGGPVARQSEHARSLKESKTATAATAVDSSGNENRPEEEQVIAAPDEVAHGESMAHGDQLDNAPPADASSAREHVAVKIDPLEPSKEETGER